MEIMRLNKKFIYENMPLYRCFVAYVFVYP